MLAHMDITLYRSGTRALFVRRERSFESLPVSVIGWLGSIEHQYETILDQKTPMLGINACDVIEDIEVRGYCALDVPVHRAFPET